MSLGVQDTLGIAEASAARARLLVLLCAPTDARSVGGDRSVRNVPGTPGISI